MVQGKGTMFQRTQQDTDRQISGRRQKHRTAISGDEQGRIHQEAELSSQT